MVRIRLAFIAALTIALCWAIAPPAPAAPSAPEYVALGDSRAAAPTRTSARQPDGCGRTPDGYPTHVAAQLGVTYKSVACVNALASDSIVEPYN